MALIFISSKKEIGESGKGSFANAALAKNGHLTTGSTYFRFQATYMLKTARKELRKIDGRKRAKCLVALRQNV